MAGLWDPFQMAVLWLINGSDPNHLHPLEMILQARNTRKFQTPWPA